MVSIVRKRKPDKKKAMATSTETPDKKKQKKSPGTLRAAIERSEKAKVELLTKFKQQKLLAGPLAKQVKTKAECRL